MSNCGKSTVIRGGRTLLPTGEALVRDLLLAEGRIQALGSGLAGERTVEAEGCWVLPGLIDLHTHGMGYEDCHAGSLVEYAQLEAASGATTVYATLYGSAEENAEVLERQRRETDELRATPNVAGFRLEFPYVAQPGAGALDDLGTITPERTRLMRAAGGSHLKIWDVAPELPGAVEFIREAAALGIVTSLCHTRATVEQARAAVDAGARLVTHLYDVFVLPEVTEGGVYPAGLVDYLLLEDRVVCEIIPDGTHVPPLGVEKAYRCKTPRGLAMITDSAFGSGLPPGEYVQPDSGKLYVIRDRNDGRRDHAQRMGLSGSALTPLDAFRNTVNMFGKGVAVASQVCSATPARLMGLNKGEIAVGRDADLVVLNPAFEVRATLVAGQVVYQPG